MSNRPSLLKLKNLSIIAGIVLVVFTCIYYYTQIIISLNVKPEDKPAAAEPKTPAAPVAVEGCFYPSGFIGDYDDLTLDGASTEDPHSADTCVKATYSAKKSQGKGWAGVYWLYPEGNWGEKPGYDFSGKAFTKLTFWAKGRASVTFKVGGIKDSVPASSGMKALSDKWEKYTIDLSGLDLGNVIGGFCFTADYQSNPEGCVFYLDDIQFE
ncbi:MAG: hypothetical protein Q8878_09940 [Bacillota bacterium]|nr:hypothetical protein [Bacillota bacterium]